MRTHIETTIYGTGRGHRSPLGIVLYVLSLIYGIVVRLRAWGFRRGLRKSRKLPCAVVSIGNITVGGTGKTPMTIHVAGRARDLGYKVVVLSRGYQGDDEDRGGIVSDGRSLLMGPDRAGDEPYMMAGKLQDIPVIVGKDRYRQGMAAMDRFHPDIMILDDGFQHLPLRRDLDLVLLDSEDPIGNGYLLPRGPLRESLGALDRGDGFISTRWRGGTVPGEAGYPAGNRLLSSRIAGRPHFRSTHTPRLSKVIRGTGGTPEQGDPLENVTQLRGRAVHAFSGIARNDDFKATVEGLGCRVVGFEGFPDHHAYHSSDLDRIKILAEGSAAEFILTTEKDMVRIPDATIWPVDLVVIGVAIEFVADGADGMSFDGFLAQQLRRIVDR